MDFLLKEFNSDGGLMFHTWKNGKASHPAFLDDYNFLIMALIELAQATANYTYLDKALAVMDTVIENFEDESSELYFFTNKNQKDVLLRKTEIYDGAVPSGNAIMAYNLYQLSKFYDKGDWLKKSESMLGLMGEVAIKYPTSFSMWLCLILETIYGTNEIAIIGNEWEKYHKNVLKSYIPHKVVMSSNKSIDRYPLLANKASNSEVLLYLCKNYACNQPVKTVERLISLLKLK
jgi:hypothetical protein